MTTQNAKNHLDPAKQTYEIKKFESKLILSQIKRYNSLKVR